MEKINKEELMKKLNLTDEELDKVVGGVNWQCFGECILNGGGSNLPNDTQLDADVPLVVKCFEQC